MPANRFALNRRHALTAAAGALMALSIAAPAAAQTFPAKPITFVVPFAAGSATDQLARAIGQSITNDTKQATDRKINHTRSSMAGVLGRLVPYTTDKSLVDWLVMLEAVAQPVDLE